VAEALIYVAEASPVNLKYLAEYKSSNDNYMLIYKQIATIQPTTQNKLKQLLLVWYYNR
jgi:hypothetical protein